MNVWCIFQSCSSFGFFQSQPVPFKKVSTHWIRRFLPCLVAVHVVSRRQVLTMSAPWLRSSSPGVQNTVWCLRIPRIPVGGFFQMTHLDPPWSTCVFETYFFKSGKWMKMVFSCCYFWGRRMPLGKMWHRRSFSRRLKAFALCLVWRRCCVPNCCDRCRLMTWEGSKRNGFQNYCKLFWVWFQIWFLCQYKFWYDFGMGFVEFPFFWPVLVSGCLQIELPASFDGNKQENYKKLLRLFWSNSCQKPINIHIWSCIDITSKRNPISRSITIYLSHFSAMLIS